jgi:hypothetical protein
MNLITKINLSDGPQLGSQMSNYAGLYAVSKKLNSEIIFIKDYINFGRGVKLFEAFDLKDKIINEPIILNKYELKNTILDLQVFYLDSKKNWDIGGWFHTYHYWHEYRDDLLNIFAFKKNIRQVAEKNIAIIKNNDNIPIVSLHVRRGDYLQVSSLNLNLDYYKSAIDLLKNKLKNFKILIFSDDVQWCKENIVGNNIYYSEKNTNYVDMCMMTLCDHNIIANSTFSWWGAYLNKNLNNITICPEDYIGESSPEYLFLNKNYYPKNWYPMKLNNL